MKSAMRIDNGDPTWLTTLYVTVTLISITALLQSYHRVKKYFRKQLGYSQVLTLEDIPGPKPLLPIRLIGNLPSLLPFSKSFDKGLKWHKDYPLLRITGANKSFICFNTPSLVQQLLKSTNFGHGIKAPVFYDNMKPFITNGVLVSRGKFWQEQRKILTRSQSFQSLKAYVDCLNKHSESFVEELEKVFRDGKPHQINGAINILFLKVICEMITGHNVDSSSELDRYHHNFQMYCSWKESIVLRALQPWLLLKPLWSLHPMSRRQEDAVTEMTGFARKLIEEHKDRRRELGMQVVEEHEAYPFKCVIQEMLDVGVDDDQILDEVNTMIFGGHETGATAIHFFCFSMALNPHIQALCRKEIDELFQNPDCFKNGVITFEAIQSNLKYVERCLLETLRLFPPVFIFLRELESSLTVEHENKSYDLPVGTNVIVSPFSIQRDPNIFMHPNKFDPDRFLPEQVAKRHSYSFIPFSGGQRSCLGQKFAMMEMKMVAAHVLRNFVISTTDKMDDIPLLPFITLTPERDYIFMLHKRSH